MVIEDFEHVLAPRKLFRTRRIVSPTGGAQNLGEPDLLNLKPPTHVTLCANPSEFQQLTHPKNRYKFCKIRENRARDTRLRSVYIPHFDQISVKISVLGSYTLIVAPMGVKFGTEPLLHAKFLPHRCNVSPLRGEKPQNRPLLK